MKILDAKKKLQHIEYKFTNDVVMVNAYAATFEFII